MTETFSEKQVILMLIFAIAFIGCFIYYKYIYREKTIEKFTNDITEGLCYIKLSNTGETLAFSSSSAKLYPADDLVSRVPWRLVATDKPDVFYIQNTWRCPDEGRCGSWLAFSNYSINIIGKTDIVNRVPWKFIPLGNNTYKIVNLWKCDSKEGRCGMYIGTSGADCILTNEDNSSIWTIEPINIQMSQIPITTVISWWDADKLAKDNGGRLPTKKEFRDLSIFIGDQKLYRLDILRQTTDRDMWMPATNGTKTNDWVLVSSTVSSRPIYSSHIDDAGGEPSWGLNNISEYYRPGPIVPRTATVFSSRMPLVAPTSINYIYIVKEPVITIPITTQNIIPIEDYGKFDIPPTDYGKFAMLNEFPFSSSDYATGYQLRIPVGKYTLDQLRARWPQFKDKTISSIRTNGTQVILHSNKNLNEYPTNQYIIIKDNVSDLTSLSWNNMVSSIEIYPKNKIVPYDYKKYIRCFEYPLEDPKFPISKFLDLEPGKYDNASLLNKMSDWTNGIMAVNTNGLDAVLFESENLSNSGEENNVLEINSNMVDLSTKTMGMQTWENKTQSIHVLQLDEVLPSKFMTFARLIQYCPDDKNFEKSIQVDVPPGKFTLANLQKLGNFQNDAMSYIVPNGLHVDVFDGSDATGNKITITPSDGPICLNTKLDLSNKLWGNRLSSITVRHPITKAYGNYNHYKGWDIKGLDHKNMPMYNMTEKECIEKCEITDNCFATTYDKDNSYCYLKDFCKVESDCNDTINRSTKRINAPMDTSNTIDTFIRDDAVGLPKAIPSNRNVNEISNILLSNKNVLNNIGGSKNSIGLLEKKRIAQNKNITSANMDLDSHETDLTVNILKDLELLKAKLIFNLFPRKN